MNVYKRYTDLAESTLLDQAVVNLGKKSIVAVGIISILSGPFSSIFPIVCLLIRPHITDINLRRSLSWATIIWLLISGVSMWPSILTIIEIVREGFRYGLPKMMHWLGQKLDRDPVAETLFRRLCRLIRQTNKQPVTVTLTQLSTHLMAFKHRDESEPFTDDEVAKSRKVFSHFEETCFVIDREYKSVTVFFPSFVFRISGIGVQMTSDEAVKLIRSSNVHLLADKPSDESTDKPSDKPSDKRSDRLTGWLTGWPSRKPSNRCAICLEDLSDVSVTLKCTHQFCLNCIFGWLNQQYTCPYCRTIIN